MNKQTSEFESTVWVADIPSVILGVLAGFFAAIIGLKLADYKISQTALFEKPVIEKAEDEPFIFEFYDALKVYEVPPKNY